MSPAAKRGPHTSVLSTLNWRFSQASHRPADEGQLWAQADRRRRSLRLGARIERAARHAAAQLVVPARRLAASAALVCLDDEIFDAEILLLSVVHAVVR